MTKTGRIYKIINQDSSVCYVGSTFHTLKHRFSVHKKDSKNEKKKMRCTIHNLFREQGAENFKIILLKQYNVEDKKHLEAYEQLWINKMNCINKRGAIPFLYKDIIVKIHKRNYLQRNRERINEKQRLRYHENKKKKTKS